MPIEIQLPRPQLNAIQWVADRRNGDASLVTPDTLRALEENGFITFKNLVKSDPFPYPVDGIDPAQARVPFLNAKAWEISGRPRREGIVRIVFKSHDPDNDIKRCEIEIAPCYPGIAVTSLGVKTEMPESGNVDVRADVIAGRIRWIFDYNDLAGSMAAFTRLVIDAAFQSGWRGATVDDQTLWWDGRKVEIERGTDAGTAIRSIFRGMGLDEALLPDSFPGAEPKSKTRSLEFA